MNENICEERTVVSCYRCGKCMEKTEVYWIPSTVLPREERPVCLVCLDNINRGYR